MGQVRICRGGEFNVMYQHTSDRNRNMMAAESSFGPSLLQLVKARCRELRAKP